MEQNNLSFTIVTRLSLWFLSLIKFLLQKQAKKQNRRNLRKERPCPWCWQNTQLTTRSITASSAISTWTLTLLHRLVPRPTGKLHPWFFCGLSRHTALASGLMLSPSLRWNCLISSILRGDIELQTLEHQLCLLRSAWAVLFSSCLWQRVNIVTSCLKPKHYSACPEGPQCLMAEDCKIEREACLT